MAETLTFCLECGARVTDWTDGVCPDSADKRHGPLKDVEYIPALTLSPRDYMEGVTDGRKESEARVAELEAALESCRRWLDFPGPRVSEQEMRREVCAALKGTDLEN